MNDNPFYHLGPIRQAEHFYNRRSEVRNVLRLLSKSQNVEVRGPRRIGKTSFLHYISDLANWHAHNIDPHHNLPVIIDCQDLVGQGKQAQVYQIMLERIVESARRLGIDSVFASWDEPTGGKAFRSTLKDLSQGGLRTVLLLDEFENMAHNAHLGPGFFSNLRALCSADDIAVVYVTASCVSLADLCLERQSLLSSPFFNLFRPIRLGLFSKQDSRRLIEDSLCRVDARFPGELVDMVLEVGGGHPCFLQIAGYHAFNLVDTDGELTQDQYKAFRRAFNAEATAHFKYFWQKLDEQEQYVLAALPLVWKDLNYLETVEHLRNQCLIAKDNNRYDYFSPLLEEFVRRQNVRGLLQSGPLLVDQRRHQVSLKGERLNVSPTSYALLSCLMGRAGQLVSKEELYRAVWPDEPHTTDQQLKSGIKGLRRDLGEAANCIHNERGIGFVFLQPGASW